MPWLAPRSLIGGPPRSRPWPLRCPRRHNAAARFWARRRSFDLRALDALACLPRRRREAVLAPLPRRRDDAHAQHLLGCAQVVDAAGDRPPAVAGRLEKAAARQPFFLGERRHVAIESAARDLEAKQRQPILESIEGDEAAVPRGRLAMPEVAPRAEERERIESCDQRLPFGPHG